MAFPTSPTNGQQANINGITYTYSSAATAWTVSTSVSNTFVSINVSANVNSANVLATGVISATGNVLGGNLSGTSIVGTLTTAAQTNITSVGTLGSLTITANTTSGNLLTGGAISATGNITGGNILGGANVNATTHTGTTVSITGNISANNATFTSNQTLSYGTANGVAYLNGSKVLTTGSALVFDGTNLGIGSTTAKKFVVNQTGATGYFLSGEASGTEIAYWYYDANSIQFSSASAGRALTFLTADTERARIDSSGNFMVGTTTASYTASGRGTITLGGSSSALYALQTGGTQKGYLYHDGTDMYLFSNASGRITITPQSSGVYLANGATSWTSNSDERKKDIIEPILNAATKVSTLRAVIGKYKTDNDGRRRSFLIAQDVQAVLPEAVDASNPDDLGIQYTEVIPLLVAAIKEQQALITTLTDRITALENA